jgi:hypothetical protein
MWGETVWLLPRSLDGTDAHGNAVPSWPEGPEADGAVEIHGVKVAPRTDLGGEAALADREAVVTNVRLLFPGGADLPAPVDRLWVRGHVYDVIGEPGTWVNPWTGREAGSEIHARRTEG